jgi:hypothetical protein
MNNINTLGYDERNDSFSRFEKYPNLYSQIDQLFF